MGMLVLAYRDLEDIDDVPPLGTEDAACLEELRAVLLRHNAIERFGITLLHSHFPVREGERLLETCDTDQRRLTVQPVPDDALIGREIVETEWRFDRSGDIQAAMTCAKACVAKNKSHTRTHVKVAPVKP